MLRTPLLVLALSFLAQSAIADPPVSENQILYIGDSISYGVFGGTLDAAFRQLSPNVTTEASCGSAPSNWLPQTGKGSGYAKTVCGFWKKSGPSPSDEIRSKNYNTPQLTQELASLHPVVTIVQLGTNIAAGAKPSTAFASVKQMMQDIISSGSKCVWIGPPAADSKIVTVPKLQITDNLIKGIAESMGCFYTRTLTYTTAPPLPGDGIHPGPNLARTWAEDVLSRIGSVVSEDLKSPNVPRQEEEKPKQKPAAKILSP